jgi:hypothetical protein
MRWARGLSHGFPFFRGMSLPEQKIILGLGFDMTSCGSAEKTLQQRSTGKTYAAKAGSGAEHTAIQLQETIGALSGGFDLLKNV